MALILKCILYPNSHYFVSSGGKDQAASILQEKSELLLKLIPALKREIRMNRGESKLSKDDFVLKFKNHSQLDVFAASERTRGKRATGGSLEEVILIDGQILNDILIPTMNVDRRLSDGSFAKNEMANKSQIYITTAGITQSFAYQKLLDVLVSQVIDQDKSMVIGGTWRIPVMEGLLPKSTIDELKLSDSYTDASFDREYESIWAGTSEEAFFPLDLIEKRRRMLVPETQYTKQNQHNFYYILSMDVGRTGDKSEICVIKVFPLGDGDAQCKLVNIYTVMDSHSGAQALFAKKLYYRYKARRLIVDANGVGRGVVDFLTVPQIDEEGNVYPDFGVYNDEKGIYKDKKTSDCVENAIYTIMANPGFNTDAHANLQNHLVNNRLHLLIDERAAQERLLATPKGAKMSPEQRAEELLPFAQTSILVQQLVNLKELNEDKQIKLRQITRKIKKDKFSALEYGLWYVKYVEEFGRKKKKVNFADAMFMG